MCTSAMNAPSVRPFILRSFGPAGPCKLRLSLCSSIRLDWPNLHFLPLPWEVLSRYCREFSARCGAEGQVVPTRYLRWSQCWVLVSPWFMKRASNSSASGNILRPKHPARPLKNHVVPWPHGLGVSCVKLVEDICVIFPGRPPIPLSLSRDREGRISTGG